MEARLLTDKDFVYTPIGTCITKRWRTYGWIPASEDADIVKKWQQYQTIPNRELN
jgi:hypothetical protein